MSERQEHTEGMAEYRHHIPTDGWGEDGVEHRVALPTKPYERQLLFYGPNAEADARRFVALWNWGFRHNLTTEEIETAGNPVDLQSRITAARNHLTVGNDGRETTRLALKALYPAPKED